ncbi:uncharacterized membrane-anchored protein YitT (DUF2179 family) [Pseudomonas sp. JAI111]|nr:uncharacterized membrane-anchored protein YitT (DUF2179 family) [Pseudomonas sp. JAI111]
MVNLSLYSLGYKRLGAPSILRTCAAVCTLAVLSNVIPHLISYDTINPLFAAVAGGTLIGVGLVFFC